MVIAPFPCTNQRAPIGCLRTIKKMSSNEYRTGMLKDILKSMKNNDKPWLDLQKACSRYQAALKTSVAAGLAFADALQAVGATAANVKNGSTDLGTAIIQMAEIQKNMESQQDNFCKLLQDEMINPLGIAIENSKYVANRIEKDFLRQHKKLLSDLKAAESMTLKSSKRPDALKQSISVVTDRVKEMESMIQSKLYEAMVEDRKRYCFLILHCNTMFKQRTNAFENTTNSVNGYLPSWTQMSISSDILPPESEKLVTAQQRTFVPIQAEGNGGQDSYSTAYDFGDFGQDEDESNNITSPGYNSYNSSSTSPYNNYGPSSQFSLPPNGGGGNSNYNSSSASSSSSYPSSSSSYSNSSSSSYSTSLSSAPSIKRSSDNRFGSAAPATTSLAPTSSAPVGPDGYAVGDTVIALYPFTATDGSNISFDKGDSILVTELSNSGWTQGEINGRFGWFPSNYVEPKPRMQLQAPPPPPMTQAPITLASSNSSSSSSSSSSSYSRGSPSVNPSPTLPRPNRTSNEVPSNLTRSGSNLPLAGFNSGTMSRATANVASPPPPTMPRPGVNRLTPPESDYGQRNNNMGGGYSSSGYSSAPPPPPAPSAFGGGGGGGAPPPPPAPPVASSGGGDRGALLNQIHKGKTLKKTVTNDRSSPRLGVK